MTENYVESRALDAGLLPSGMRRALRSISVWHPQSLALQLGHTDAAKLLDETLADETWTDKTLTQLSGPADSAAVAKMAA